MSRALLCALLVACADARFAPLSKTLPAWHDPLQVATYTLANGMKVALLRDPAARVASVDLRLEVGAADDPIDHPGMAADLAYLVTETPQHALRTQLAVDADRTEIVSTTLTLDAALDTEAHRFELTCDELAPGITRAYGAALAQARPAPLAAAIWGVAHPYARLVANPTVPPPSPADVCAFYQQHYVASAATLVVTGPFDGGLLSRIRARFERLPTRPPPSRAVVAPIETGAVKLAVPGLSHAMVMMAVPAPAVGDPDEVLAELAVRRIASWDNRLHVFLTGGHRARALVIAVEDPNGKAIIDQMLERSDLLAEDADARTSEDYLTEQQRVEDIITRTTALADDVASHRRVDRLRRLRALRGVTRLRIWIRDHVKDHPARVLMLVPDGAPAPGAPEELGVPPSIADGDRPAESTSYAALAPDALLDSYTLPNGLHVVLAPMRGATTVDARLILPVGTRHEPAPGIAQRAAAELTRTEKGETAGSSFQSKLEWYEDQGPRSEIAVTSTTTRFRVVGAAGLADWHVFMLGWLITAGHYPNDADTLGQMRRYYGPRNATLIVTGDFDAARMRDHVALWFGDWRDNAAAPLAAGRSGTEAIAVAEPTERVDLGIVYSDYGGPVAEGRLLAELIEARTQAALGPVASTVAAYDARGSGELAIRAELDPATTGTAGETLAGTIDGLCAQPVTERELDHARRRAITGLLELSVTATGRAHQLEERIGASDGPDAELTGLAQATSGDVQDDCRLVHRDHRRVMVHGPRGSISVLLSALGVDLRRTMFTAAN